MRPENLDSFGEFFAASSNALRRVAYALTGDWHRADDAVQMTFEKLATAWERMDGRDPFFYARKVLYREVIAQTRKPWFRHERTVSAVREHRADIQDSYPSDDAVLPVLRELSAQQRAVVILRYYEDASVEEAARILHCSQGNVKRHTHDALRRLSFLMEPTNDAAPKSPRRK